MGESYDIVAVGAGHNGLVAAAYLAKAGKKVLVLERNAYAGGGVVTQELTAPGFHHDRHSSCHIFVLRNPMLVNDELGLKSKFGLEYIVPETPLGSMFDDGSVLLTHSSVERSCDVIAQFSKRDAEAYARFVALAIRTLPMILSSLFTPPLPVGALMATLDQSPEGREIFQMMMKSGWDIVSEWFESDRLKIHLLKFVSENLQGPEEKGTGIGLLVMLGLLHTSGFGLPKGGAGKLTEALVKCIEHHGGVVRTGQDVTRIFVSAGRASGVEVASGEQFAAKDAVIGAIHPYLLPKFFPQIDPAVASRARQVQVSSFSGLMSHYALKERPRFRGDGEALHQAYMTETLPARMETFRRFFDNFRYGRIPDPFTTHSIGIQSNHDPSRAPEGRAVLYLFGFCPNRPEGREARYWDQIKEEVGDRIIRDLGVFVSNITPDNIIARHLDTPLDFERSSASFQLGDIHGAGPHIYQSNGHRPTSDLAQYKIPGIERFYLVGPFMHPGGGVFGAGRGTAIKMFEDLKMDFDKVSGAVS